MATLEVLTTTNLDDRKGMYLVSEPNQEISCREFEAEVKLIRSSVSGDSSPKASFQSKVGRIKEYDS